ncbi:MAG: DUF3291 domain-containing protein [Nevskia sp.]|nr:DUF3291 domain-containing protein [Nevskia sp.]
MAQWHIAQLNVGRTVALPGESALAGFMARLDEINALAEASPGFVWRLQNDSGNATDIRVSDDPYFLVNLSVWASVEALFEFVYRTVHTQVMARRREWFEQPAEAYQVLWWVPAGHVPTVQEALERLAHLRLHGPTPKAFTFKSRYPQPDEGGGPQDMYPEPYCIGWN